MARTLFEQELEQLNLDLIKMGAMVEEAIENTVTAFRTQDMALAKEIIAGDRKVNDMEKSIEARCLTLIMRQQPVARDLRAVSTALKAVTDMERIGDQAADIAEIVMRMPEQYNYHAIEHIPAMAKNAKLMVNQAIQAFVDGDLKLAKDVEEHDDIVDDLFNQVKDEIVRVMKQEEAEIDEGIDLLIIAKYLERIGDHAVNICEWVHFAETGELKNRKLI